MNLGQHSSPIPTDGDIHEIAPYIETEDASAWPQWFEILGEPSKGIHYNHLLQLAVAAARWDTGGDRGAKTPTEIGERISDLDDKLDSVIAVQLPVIDYLERISSVVDSLGSRSRFKIEESLKEALGEKIYSTLCDDAKLALLDAERRHQDQGTIDWNAVTESFGKAIEFQVKQRFLPCPFGRGA